MVTSPMQSAGLLLMAGKVMSGFCDCVCWRSGLLAHSQNQDMLNAVVNQIATVAKEENKDERKSQTR